MKLRLSYFFILVIIILTVFTGRLIWVNNHNYNNENYKQDEKSLTFPISSNYIPSNAELVFHWKINPNEITNYTWNYKDKVNKDKTSRKLKLIRDSLFNLINLDFKQDLSKWAGKYGSFAIFDTKKQTFNDWILILEINEDINIIEDWKSILEKNFNTNNNLEISQEKDFLKEIISNNSIYFEKDQQHILISPNRERIDLSINYSKNNLLTNKEKFRKIQLQNKINDGMFLLEISPQNIFNMIGQKRNLFEIDEADKLLSSIRIDKENIRLDGIISYENKIIRPIDEPSNYTNNIGKNLNSFDNSILIDNPKKYFEENYLHSYQKSILSIIQETLKDDNSSLFKLILKNTKGNLIWLKDKNWLALTKKSDINKKAINDILEKNNFLKSSLDSNEKNLEVWSKIITDTNEKYKIKMDIGVIVKEYDDKYIWSQDLQSISNFDNNSYFLNNNDVENITRENNDFENIIRVRLGKQETRELLNGFYPYILLKTMLGNQLDFPKNIEISISIPTINYVDFFKFKINLKTS